MHVGTSFMTARTRQDKNLFIPHTEKKILKKQKKKKKFNATYVRYKPPRKQLKANLKL